MNEREKTFQEAMNLGHSAAWDQNWEEAVTHYRQAVQIAPGRAQAINNLGLAYFQLNRFNEADKLRKQQVERAEYEANLARRRFMQVDPDNPLHYKNSTVPLEKTGMKYGIWPVLPDSQSHRNHWRKMDDPDHPRIIDGRHPIQ